MSAAAINTNNLTIRTADGTLILGAGGKLASTYIQSVAADKIVTPNLAALSANIGLLRTAATGGRVEISDNVIKLYDAFNNLRMKIGDQTL